MRSMLTFLSLSSILVCGSTAQAIVDFDWVLVEGVANACQVKPQGCFGAVDYRFSISALETTNAQYAEFLNAVAATDTHALYNAGNSGIVRSGSPGTYLYSVAFGAEDEPANYVDFWDVLRFVNWLHNDQRSGVQNSSTTEDGAYTLTAPAIAANSVVRNFDAKFYLTNEDEWYKAAYYDDSPSYYSFPTRTDTLIGCDTPGATPNTANCNMAVLGVTDVGGYTASVGPWGTFDQGGNVWEWSESIETTNRVIRGGSFSNAASSLSSSSRTAAGPTFASDIVGFRVAGPQIHAIPALNPASLLGLMGLLGAAGWCRLRL